RHRRRFNEIGTLRFELFDNGINAQQAVAQALQFKKAWLRKYGYNCTICNRVNSSLLTAIARGGKNPVQSLVSVLYLDAEPIAIEVGFGWMKHHYAHIGAYNPWFAKFGPGKILMEETISTLMARGFETYDQIAPADSYKREWETSLVGVRDHALPVNLRGMTHMGLYLKLIRPGIKNVYQQLPEPVRQRLNRFAESA
ncbi:MAG: GNAT family N-acetyltransferase, partial [Rhizobiales bacterium]|nr:GNAT family N-acetyltransferase [Hyphomicrobiales bacterium]